MRVLLQSEAGDCGLACLAMVADAHGLRLDLATLRRRFPGAGRGLSLQRLMAQAAALGLAARPLRLEPAELPRLQCPCILHWRLDHYVVLVRAGRRRLRLVDPAVGARWLSAAEVERAFSGVALELSPQPGFQRRDVAPRLALRSLTGPVRGLGKALAQVLAVSLVLELFAIAAPLAQQTVVDQAIGAGDHELLTVVALGFGLLLAVQTALGLARSWMLLVLGQSVALQWSGRVFAHLLRLPAGFFEQRHLGDVASRFGALGALQRGLTTAFTEVLLDGVMALAALGMMLAYAPDLTAVTLAAVVLYALLRVAAYRPLREAQAERLVMAAREHGHFLETLRAIVPIRLFGREEDRRARWQNLLVEVHNRDVRSARLGIVLSGAQALVFGTEGLLVLWLGAARVMDSPPAAAEGGGFTVGMLFAFIAYKAQFGGRVAALIDAAVQWRMMGLHAERLADLALAEPEPDDLPERDLADLPASLELVNLGYRHGEDQPWLLRHAALRVAAGECVAITGGSGAGKTTLLKLLLGLLTPTEGEVRYGGVPLRQLGRANLRRCIGTVMQDDQLLGGSVEDNICFFDPAPDPARVQACARLAQVHDELLRLPMGYHTRVGDLGGGLSGGQRQRVLLARALYKRPAVLALDEATSHLDPATEHAVLAALAPLGLTRLMIAHRPETVAAAQRVLMLRDGGLSEVAAPGAAPDAAQGTAAAGRAPPISRPAPAPGSCG